MATKGLIMIFAVVFVVIGIFALPGRALAHCDTLDGPVVTTARTALEKSDVTPVLKWVRKDDEQAIKDLFRKTLAVRAKGPEAKELADMYFFETLVRIHRAGEGAPYTGLKPAGVVEVAVAGADRALETGSVDNLVKLITGASSDGIRERFNRASELKKHADESVEAGRQFVEAYVEFTHYVERIHLDALGPAEHHGEMKKEGAEGHHHH